MQDKLLTIHQVIEILGVSRSTIYRWQNKGDFPAARKIGLNTARWRLSDIEAWQKEIFG